MASRLRFTIFILAAVIASVASAAEPADSPALDWADWKALPVHDSGRVMPLDTLARTWVREICGRVNPKLQPVESDSEEPAGQGGATGANPLFPDGQPRKFDAAEVLFSWLVEPERWQDVAFLDASYEDLRRDLLEVPLRDAQGNRLKHVSPSQLEQAGKARQRVAELVRQQRQASAAGKKFELTDEIDRRLDRLYGAYDAYRGIVLDPKAPARRRAVFLARLMEVLSTWRRRMAGPVEMWQSLNETPRQKELIDGINRSTQKLIDLLDEEEFSLTEAERPVADLCRDSRSLAALIDAERDRKVASDDAKLARQRRVLMDNLAAQSTQLLDEARSLREALYDDGDGVRVVPSASPFGLRDEGDLGGRPQPWLTLESVLFGAEADLVDYPADKLEQAREAFKRAKAAYLDRQTADRPACFAKAMRELAVAVRGMGEAVEPVRRELLTANMLTTPDEPEEDADDRADSDEQAKARAEKEREAARLLDMTAYPTQGEFDDELFYNRLDPFLWAWVLTAAAIGIVALGIGPARKPMFFLGAAVLTAGQVFTVVGLLLRASITEMVPVTNMYETVLFAAATVALLGLWFSLLPITWPVITAAWQITAIAISPQTAAGGGLSGDAARWFWRTMPFFRGALGVLVFYLLAIGHFNPSAKGPVVALLPSFTSVTILGMVGSLVIWLLGLVILVWAVWFLPRAVLTIALSITTAPKALWVLYAGRLSRPIDQVVARRPFLLAGAAVALLAYLVAYYVPGPVFNRDVGTGMAAILRSNFWLALHVLTVTASYGAGALAWGLAIISLGYYTFGRYRTPEAIPPELLAAGHRPADGYEAPASSLTRRPPAICAKLAGYIYKTIQVAVLLLAVGTITGAIWADYAWGRYWGWDPKEVWALISLLVYLAVLHGRWAGWTGNFGIAVGAVLGATAILMTWYGVNFLIKFGLHSYGQGSGGETYVVVCVAANWWLVLVATMRYFIERRTVTKSE